MAMVQDPNHPDGVRDDGAAVASHGESDDLQAARMRKGMAATDWYLRTRSWERAAELAGYPTARAARVASEKAVLADTKTNARTQAYMRTTMSRHLELMLGSLVTKTMDTNHPEHLAAIKTARELLATQAKLLGLDAPTKLSLIDPTQEQIEAFLNDKIGPRTTDEEADIFDAEFEEIDPPALEG